MPHGLRTSRTAGVLTLRIDRPDRMNALDGPTATALLDALDSAASNPAVRVVIVTGTGSAFSTGADVADIAAANAGSAAQSRAHAEDTMRVAGALVRAILAVPVPVIAQVNGIAAGIGVSIALSADLIYASDTAQFLLAFTSVGLMPDGGASLLVPAAIGRARATAMAMLGQPMSAEHAVATGLITDMRPADQLDTHVAAIAEQLARGPRRALELTKRALVDSTLGLLDDALERERAGQIELLGSPDFSEGVEALLRHRRPQFGRESR